jgi:manganese transport system ATP-binding protein
VARTYIQFLFFNSEFCNNCDSSSYSVLYHLIVDATEADTMNAVVAHEISVIRDGRIALGKSSFSIPQNKITALIGPNGSGKSTLLHAIADLLPLASGELTILNQSVAAMKSQISYVFQHQVLSQQAPMTVQRMVEIGRWANKRPWDRFTKEDSSIVLEAMNRLNITDLAERQITQLSGGQLQRVFVAQGVAATHSILLLDEPLTGLDVTSAQIIDDLIHEEPTRGCTVVLTTHDIDEARAADHVLLLSGSVIASGHPRDVLTKENLENAYRLKSMHATTTDPFHFETDQH